MLFHDTNLVNYKKLKHIHTSLVFSMNTVHSTCILLISNIYNAFFDKITYCQVGRSIFYFLLDLKRALGWTIYFGDSIWRNGILFPKLFWPTVRKSCSSFLGAYEDLWCYWGQIMPTTLLLAHPDLKTQRQLCNRPHFGSFCR